MIRSTFTVTSLARRSWKCSPLWKTNRPSFLLSFFPSKQTIHTIRCRQSPGKWNFTSSRRNNNLQDYWKTVDWDFSFRIHWLEPILDLLLKNKIKFLRIIFFFFRSCNPFTFHAACVMLKVLNILCSFHSSLFRMLYEFSNLSNKILNREIRLDLWSFSIVIWITNIDIYIFIYREKTNRSIKKVSKLFSLKWVRSIRRYS